MIKASKKYALILSFTAIGSMLLYFFLSNNSLELGTECPSILGKGLLNGQPAIAVGVCESFMHEHEEWIEFYPENSDWKDKTSKKDRIGTLDPEDFGIKVSDDGSHIFGMLRPEKIEFDGGSDVIVQSADGERRRIRVGF